MASQSARPGGDGRWIWAGTCASAAHAAAARMQTKTRHYPANRDSLGCADGAAKAFIGWRQPSDGPCVGTPGATAGRGANRALRGRVPAGEARFRFAVDIAGRHGSHHGRWVGCHTFYMKSPSQTTDCVARGGKPVTFVSVKHFALAALL